MMIFFRAAFAVDAGKVFLLVRMGDVCQAEMVSTRLSSQQKRGVTSQGCLGGQ